MDTFVITSRENGSYLCASFNRQSSGDLSNAWLSGALERFVRSCNLHAEKAERIESFIRVRERSTHEDERSKIMLDHLFELFDSQQYKPYISTTAKVVFISCGKNIEEDLQFIESITDRVPFDLTEVVVEYSQFGEWHTTQHEKCTKFTERINRKRKLIHGSVEDKLETIFQ